MHPYPQQYLRCVCIHVYQRPHQSSSKSMSSSMPVSGHVSRGLTAQHQEDGWDVLLLAWHTEQGQGVSGIWEGDGIKNWPSRRFVSPAPQLQAPLRRFLRQEMVIEVVRSVPLSTYLFPSPYFVHAPAHTCCPWACLLFPTTGVPGRVPTLPLPLGIGGRALTPLWAWLSPWALWAGGWASGPESCLGPHRRQLAARRTGPSSCSLTSSSAPP